MRRSPPLLMLGCFLFGSCSTVGRGEATRTSLTSSYALVLAAHDANGDKKLGRGEVEAMVNLVFPKDRPVLNSAELRDWVIADYAAQDTDEDGFLTLAELLKDPLTSFECMDVNKNDRLSRREVEVRMGDCPSKTYRSRIGFISEPKNM